MKHVTTLRHVNAVGRRLFDLMSPHRYFPNSVPSLRPLYDLNLSRPHQQWLCCAYDLAFRQQKVYDQLYALSAAMRASRSVATAEATAPFRTRLDPDQPEFGGKRKS
jgi:hypothetical protein